MIEYLPILGVIVLFILLQLWNEPPEAPDELDTFQTWAQAHALDLTRETPTTYLSEKTQLAWTAYNLGLRTPCYQRYNR